MPLPFLRAPRARSAALVAFALSFINVVRAQSIQPVGAERFRLRWVAAEGACPLEREVGAEALRLLDASPRSTAAPLEVNAQVSATPGGYQLAMTLGVGAQARTRFLTAPTCQELAHAGALIVALAIDPTLNLGSEASSGGPQPSVTARPEPCTVVASPPVIAPPVSTARMVAPVCPRCRSCEPQAPITTKEESSRGFGVLVGTGLALGALPQVLPRASLGAAYFSNRHWLELTLSAAFATLGPRSDRSGAEFQLWSMSPRYCLRGVAGPTRLGACASVEVGLLRAEGIGSAVTHADVSPWVAPGLGMQLALPLRRGAELSLTIELGLVTSRPRFHLNGVEAFRTWPLVPSFRVSAFVDLL